jgi:hypothetical protein
MAPRRRQGIVEEANFVQATRDTGYKSTAAAAAELVDNALQAGAKNVLVTVGTDESRGRYVAVLDDGCGMDGRTLRAALQFGGSSRFNDRSGQGRYGMGLPNSSVSQARRVEVYTWRVRNKVLFSYIDVDEIARGEMIHVPPARRRQLPKWLPLKPATKSGTLVLWLECDRLDGVRTDTITKRLHGPLGQVFRYFLWNGSSIVINGAKVTPIDPLFVRREDVETPATETVAPLTYKMRVPDDSGRTSEISVRFAVLPVRQLRGLTDSDKRLLGIAKGAGVSIVRAGREIDFGWFFMGAKRKENYDDWWRCEVSFEPQLDELFGVTHAKQQVTPAPGLRAVLTPDIEGVARSLNAKVRKAFARHPERAQSRAVRAATSRDALLQPVTAEPNGKRTRTRTKTVGRASPERNALRYKILVKQLATPCFYQWTLNGAMLEVTINEDHPFYRRIYGPAREARGQTLFNLECLLLSAVRAEASQKGQRASRASADRCERWSDALAAFLE